MGLSYWSAVYKEVLDSCQSQTIFGLLGANGNVCDCEKRGWGKREGKREEKDALPALLTRISTALSSFRILLANSATDLNEARSSFRKMTCEHERQLLKYDLF